MKTSDLIEQAEDAPEVFLSLDTEAELMEYFSIFTPPNE